MKLRSFSFPSLILLACLGLPHAAIAGQYSALVVEPDSGRILYEKDADGLRHPASVTKMMTLYIVFEALERGEITLNTPLEVSRNAVLRPPSRLGVMAGDTLRVEDAILALVTRSANDAATVIAENLGGTESAFGEMMTAKAHALGMKDSVFKNASGLPDPGQWTTARDMYKLGRALINDFPRYYPYFSTPRFYYRGQGFDNHNHLMETYPGMDGIKTGFINSSGFNLVASAKRGGHRLIGVVFGGPSAVRRDRHMREILDDGFAQLSGSPPRGVIAEFERVPVPRGARERIGLDSPRLVFGNPKKFKAGGGRNGVPVASVAKTPKVKAPSTHASKSVTTPAVAKVPAKGACASGKHRRPSAAKNPNLHVRRAAHHRLRGHWGRACFDSVGQPVLPVHGHVARSIRYPAMHAPNLEGAQSKLFKFLSGWLGGPNLYWEEFGHPRLRMRHFPFAIGTSERDQWMLCMNRAIEDCIEHPILRERLSNALRQTADHMINQEG